MNIALILNWSHELGFGMSFYSQHQQDTFWYSLNLKWVYTDLLRSIYAQTKNFHLSNDLLHDAIVKFAVKNSIDTVLEPHAYLRTIVKNSIVDHYRHEAHFIDVHDETNQETSQFVNVEDCKIASPERIADIKQRMQALQNIIECLPAKCRQVFWLYRIEGMAQVEIAKSMNISLNMVERHMMRALVDLSFAKDYLLKP